MDSVIVTSYPSILEVSKRHACRLNLFEEKPIAASPSAYATSAVLWVPIDGVVVVGGSHQEKIPMQPLFQTQDLVADPDFCL